jgi:hypothetical protein
MKDPGDPLDLLDDDGDPLVELSLLETEEQDRKSPPRKKSGCAPVFLALVPLLLTGGCCLYRPA